MDKALRFSLVICTLGRRDEIVELFSSFVRQSRSDYDVILVDQNTDDRLVEMCDRFAGQFALKHIRMLGTGASRARNVGLDHATGELIAFPDDDCKYLDGYLDVVDEIFTKDPSIGCISGFPTSEEQGVGSAWRGGERDLDAFEVLDRCQEFTIVVRRRALNGLRYNERLGVGARTLWGAEEGPDLLIRLVATGCRLVYFPRLFVYHPHKRGKITLFSLSRTASYARGRGCLFRLHRFPLKLVLVRLFRCAMGCGLYLLRLQPRRSAYYFVVICGILRGLLMSNAELADVRQNTRSTTKALEPVLVRE
jgi:GT2 family glycosyltransferase